MIGCLIDGSRARAPCPYRNLGVASLPCLLKLNGESPSGKAPDFDSGIRRFDPYLPSQNVVSAQANVSETNVKLA